MHAASLEPRPLYGIGTVARLTGLKPDTLRVWERRYGLGASHKSATGRRQYTQADLEHLQLISALVNAGARIGEIASSERKTLEVLLRGRGEAARGVVPPAKPRVLLIGEKLCGWLDEHQGCISNADALLGRFPLADGLIELDDIGQIDTLIVECTNLSHANVELLLALEQKLAPDRVVVTYQFGNERWLEELRSRDFAATTFPPDPAFVAYEISRGMTGKATRLGDANLGELVEAKPRQFAEAELSAARLLMNRLDCECPRHISDLISALASFEEYSASCSVENWHDAAVHSCIYAYTGQARWLMEKALQAVLEDRGEEFAALLAREKRRGLDDAA